MLEKLKQLENKYLELSARAEQPDFYADPGPRCQIPQGAAGAASPSSPPTAPGAPARRIWTTPLP